MEEKEILEYEIENLKDAYRRMQEVLNDLKDIDLLDEEYKQLYYLAENINELRIENEIKLERLEEIA